jgi:hypothetical protein
LISFTPSQTPEKKNISWSHWQFCFLRYQMFKNYVVPLFLWETRSIYRLLNIPSTEKVL